jgi:hypothetical protein
MLQHGSLPIHDDQSAVAGLMLPGAVVPAADPPATLAGLLGREPEWDQVVQALAAGWAEALGVVLDRETLSGEEEARARAHRARYEDPAWTWHR